MSARYKIGRTSEKKFVTILEKPTPQVSIIIPVYNVEAYLRPCLESATNQTLRNIEIICINDGSTDGCLGVLEEYEGKDPRIIVVNKPNAGVSSARNAGLEIATGKYVRFLDGDDILTLDACETLFNRAENDRTDIVLSNVQLVTADGQVISATGMKDVAYDFRKKKEFRLAFRQYYAMGTPWVFFRRSVLLGLHYTPLSHGEDGVFYCKAFTQANGISTISNITYLYLQRQNSATTTFTPKRFKNFSDACFLIAMTLKQSQLYFKARDIVDRHLLDLASSSFTNLLVLRKDISMFEFNELWVYWLDKFNPLFCEQESSPQWKRYGYRMLFQTKSYRIFYLLSCTQRICRFFKKGLRIMKAAVSLKSTVF